MEPLITLSEAARKIGLNKSTLSRQGKVRLSEVLEDRTNNIAVALREPVASTATGTVLIDGTVMTINDAKALKETYLARSAKLKFETDSKNLVEVDVVHKAVFDLARQDRDSWSNWPSRISPLMAAELGIEQVKCAVLLEKYVREHLAERSQAALRI
jgi:hypothetical protein